MVQVKICTVIQVFMIISVFTTCVYADFKEYCRCLNQLNYAFDGSDTLIGCVTCAIKKYVKTESIPVINLEDPTKNNSKTLPKTENHKYKNYADQLYKLMQENVLFGDVSSPHVFCSDTFPEQFKECHDAVKLKFGDTQTTAMENAFLYLKISDFKEDIYGDHYMQRILRQCHAYTSNVPGQTVTGNDLKPTNFCLKFISPDQLPMPPPKKEQKKLNDTKNKNTT